MSPQQLQERLSQLGPGTAAEVTDLTGTQDHYQVSIRSPAFQGLSLIQQHQKCFALVKAEVDSGELHALSLKTQAV